MNKYLPSTLCVAFVFWLLFFFTIQSHANTQFLSGKVIFIDPGHGGPDTGAVSKKGLIEKNVTLQIAQILRDSLQASGAIVVMSRDKDQDLSNKGTKKLNQRKKEDLNNRLKMIIKTQPSLVISIHLNAFPKRYPRGAQTIYNPDHTENRKLSLAIQKELIQTLKKARPNPDERKDIFLLKNSPVPTTLVEAGFLTNRKEADLLSQLSYQKKIAASIYDGIIAFTKENNHALQEHEKQLFLNHT